jgi:hypothetical protein
MAPVLGMQKWEGQVSEISDGLLTVDLTPLDHDGAALTAEFRQALLAPDDASVSVGDVVYLTVRTVRDQTGYSSVTSTLRLRRLGRINDAEFDDALATGRLMAALVEKYAE